MYKLLLIFVGGGAGSLLRYVFAGWVQGRSRSFAWSLFPIGTLAVNVLGSMAIGIMAALFAGPWMVREEYQVAVLVGVVGGFTTFSTFSYETLQLVTDGQWSRAALNVLLTNAMCLTAVWIGYRLTERVVGVA